MAGYARQGRRLGELQLTQSSEDWDDDELATGRRILARRSEVWNMKKDNEKLE